MSGAPGARHPARVAGALVLVMSLVVTSASLVMAMGTGQIEGMVFDDLGADGLADGTAGSVSNPGIDLVDVYLFHDDGTSPGSPDGFDTLVSGSPVATAAGGRFTIPNLADGDYWVAVDSLTIDPLAWPDQTWGPAGSLTTSGQASGAGSVYSGRTASRSDDLATVSSVADAEHIAFVTVAGGAPVTGLEFGFSHNVVTTTAGGDAADDRPTDATRSVQGSLRQFLDNAVAVAGSNAMRFVPVSALNATSGSAGWHRITVSSPLPVVSGAGTTIDGTVYSAVDGTTVLDPNAGSIGAAATSPGLTVGVDGVALAVIAKPDLELVGASGVDHAFEVNGVDSVIRDIALRGFDVSAIELTGADRSQVTQAVIGTSPDAIADPGAGARNGTGIEIAAGADGSVTESLLAHNGLAGINLPSTGTGWTLSGNEVLSNGPEASWPDGIRIYGAVDLTIRGNLVHLNQQNGIEILRPVESLTLENNTIDANGQGGGEVAGIRNLSHGAWPHTIEANVVVNNSGPGILISQDGASFPPASLVTLTRNTFGGNGRMAIDLVLDPADRVWGDGPNPLVAACGTGSGANELIDRPVITGAYAAPNWIRLIGTACAGGSLELYEAVPDADLSDTFGADSYGEPVRLLGTGVVAGDGTFDVFVPVVESVGTLVTATVTDGSGNTSEVAANQALAAVNIPSITVLGSDPTIAEAGLTYTDAGATAADVEDGDLTPAIVTVDPVDTSTLGSYLVTYDVTDLDGNPADQASRTVDVQDTTPPTLTMNGASFMGVEAGTAFTDPGATASDSFEGDLTPAIVVTGAVDPFTLGSTVLTYGVADSSGNTAPDIDRTVNVVDTIAPSLSLVGLDPLVVPQDSSFVDPGASATDSFEGDLTGSIVITGTVDTSTRGTYALTYDVSDSSGNAAPTITRDVVVADANPPVVTIIGADSVTIEAGAGYADAGALAFDAEDGDLTSSIVVTDQVDHLAPGTYAVTYAVTDLSGNAATAQRTVTVVDTTPPSIQLLGADPLVMTVGRALEDPGATAVDIVDGDLTGAIVVASTVDLDSVGSYALTYQSTDAAGNSAVVVRAVEVVPNQPPIARDDSYSATQGESLTIRAPGLLANDDDPDADPNAPTNGLVATVVEAPQHGDVTVSRDGGFVYRNDGASDTEDSFTYRVTDPDGATATATVSLSITIINRAPTTTDDVVGLDEDSTATLDVLANDADPEGDELFLLTVGSNPHVRLLATDGMVTVQPVRDWFGTTTVPYVISDGRLTAEGYIDVVVTPVNDAPTAGRDQATTEMGRAVLVPVLGNDTDVDGVLLLIDRVGAARHGSVRLLDGGIEYKPEATFIGNDWFEYAIVDEDGAVSVGRVTVEVLEIDLAAGVISGWPAPDGPGSPPPTSPGTPSDPLRQTILVPLAILVQAFFQDLLAFQVPLALLAVTLIWVLTFGRWQTSAKRRFAVVLLGREMHLPVHAGPSARSAVIHTFASAARQIDSSRRRTRVEGTTWIEVETPDGPGWTDFAHLTEDAAKATFTEDMTDGTVLRKLGGLLRDGRALPSARRGFIDVYALGRQASDLGLDAHQRRTLAEALLDPRSRILVDETATPGSLRPNELRNFHWVTVAPPAGPAWHVVFEYHRGTPRVVGVRLETAATPVPA